MLQLRLPIFQSDMLAFDPLQRILQNLWGLVPSRIRGPKTNFYGIIWLGLGPLYFETSRKIDNNVPTCSQEVQHTKYNTQKTSWGSKLQTCTLPPSPSGPKQPQLPWPFESSLPPSGTRCFRSQHHQSGFCPNWWIFPRNPLVHPHFFHIADSGCANETPEIRGS